MIPTDEEIEAAFKGAFVGTTVCPVKLLKNALLKVAAGYDNGYTATQILERFGLIKISHHGKQKKEVEYLTKLGGEALYQWFAVDVHMEATPHEPPP